jgi:hypothetical protein
MLAGVMSRCITPRRCMPPTARANRTASSISSAPLSGVGTPARLTPPTSAKTTESGYVGASSSCATPTTPRKRPNIPNSCRNRRGASAPNGCLRITAPPGKTNRVTRVRALSHSTSTPTPGSGPTPCAPIRPVTPRHPGPAVTPYLHPMPGPTRERNEEKRGGLQLRSRSRAEMPSPAGEGSRRSPRAHGLHMAQGHTLRERLLDHPRDPPGLKRKRPQLPGSDGHTCRLLGGET